MIILSDLGEISESEFSKQEIRTYYSGDVLMATFYWIVHTDLTMRNVLLIIKKKTLTMDI